MGVGTRSLFREATTRRPVVAWYERANMVPATMVVWGVPSDSPDSYFVLDVRALEVKEYLQGDVAIQAAIDALPAGGGKVVLSEGKFIISSTVNLRTYLHLVGHGIAAAGGPGITTIQLANGAECHMLDLTNTNKEPLQISDLELDGNRANQTSTDKNALCVQNASPIYFTNLTIHNATQYGIYLEHTQDFDCLGGEFVGVKVRDCGHTGIYSEGTAGTGTHTHFKILGGWSFGNDYSGLHLSDFEMASVIGFSASYNTDVGIGAGSGGGLMIDGCFFDSNDGTAGLNLGGGDITVKGSYFTNEANLDIRLNGSNRTKILGNTLKNTGSYAINIANGDDVTIADNHFYNVTDVLRDAGGTGRLIYNNEGYLGIGETRTFRKTVNYDDTSPVTVCDVEDGYMVESVFVEVTTAWDGTVSMDIGDGGDTSRFLANANIDLTSTGYQGNMSIGYVYTGTDTIDCTFSSTGTQGVAIIYAKITRIGGS